MKKYQNWLIYIIDNTYSIGGIYGKNAETS